MAQKVPTQGILSLFLRVVCCCLFTSFVWFDGRPEKDCWETLEGVFCRSFTVVGSQAREGTQMKTTPLSCKYLGWLMQEEVGTLSILSCLGHVLLWVFYPRPVRNAKADHLDLDKYSDLREMWGIRILNTRRHRRHFGSMEVSPHNGWKQSLQQWHQGLYN